MAGDGMVRLTTWRVAADVDWYEIKRSMNLDPTDRLVSIVYDDDKYVQITYAHELRVT